MAMWKLGALAAMVATVFAASSAAAAEKLALLIGNAQYDHATDLRNPVNDAKAMERTLRRLGYKTTVLRNLDRAALAEALLDFGTRAVGADTALIFFSGHGMEIRGENYLIPTDARLRRPGAEKAQAVPLSMALEATAGATRLAAVIVDACRNGAPGGERSGFSRGFRPVSPRPGLAIAFSTAPGAPAWDGEGALSPYTRALVEAINNAPDLDVRFLFTSLGAETARYAGADQRPFSRFGDLPREEVVSLSAATGSLAANSLAKDADVPVAAGRPSVGRPRASATEYASGALKKAQSPELIDILLDAYDFPEDVRREALFRREESLTSRSLIRSVQGSLAMLGLFDGAIDGAWGPKTEAALRKYLKKEVSRGAINRKFANYLAKNVIRALPNVTPPPMVFDYQYEAGCHSNLVLFFDKLDEKLGRLNVSAVREEKKQIEQCLSMGMCEWSLEVFPDHKSVIDQSTTYDAKQVARISHQIFLRIGDYPTIDPVTEGGGDTRRYMIDEIDRSPLYSRFRFISFSVSSLC